MFEESRKNAQTLFLLFNINLLLTFPFQTNQIILTHFIPLSPSVCHITSILCYLILAFLSYIQKEIEFRATISILSSLLALYHFIQLLFYI